MNGHGPWVQGASFKFIRKKAGPHWTVNRSKRGIGSWNMISQITITTFGG
jgi:hypothetical protein